MAGSLKDALRRAGLTPEAPAPQRVSKEFREELPDDEAPLPQFDKPAPKSPPHFEPTRPPRKGTP